MELDVLASVGEFLGGLAVIVSLIYVVISIRQNTRQLRENVKVQTLTEQRAGYEQHDRYRAALRDREWAELFLQIASGNQQPDAIDQLRYDQFVYQIAYAAQHQWMCVRDGVAEPDEFKRILPEMVAFFSTPGGGAWWQRYRSTLKPGYVAAIEDALHAGNPDA